MGIDVCVPGLGESVESAVVARWLKGVGDAVVEGEPILSVQTDKASVDIESPATGRVEALLVAADDAVVVGQVIARIVVAEGWAPAPRKVNIVEYFEGEARRHADAFATARAAATEARAALPALTAEVAAARAALDDKVALKRRAEQEGLDASKLDGPIAELRARLDAASARVAAREAQIEAAKPEKRRAFDREIALAESVRREMYLSDAIEIAEIRDCYRYVRVTLTEEDASGQPTAIDVRFGQAHPLRLRLRQAQPRVSSTFRPKALAWLPTSPRVDVSDPVSHDAFIDRTRGVLVLAGRSFENAIFGYRGHDLRYAELAVSLEDHLHSQLANLEPFDLDRPYPDNELAEVVRTRALALTGTTGAFRPTDVRLPSGEVAALIRDDWSAFVGCPWAADVAGALALLKYHAENGEKPRLWCEAYEGHYGFRLRTRDHSWLVGELFVTPGLPAPSARESLVVAVARAGSSGPAIAQLGRLHLKVEERG